MNHSLVISTIINSMANVNSYLELGIYEGETFEKIRTSINRCVGVDIVDKRKIKFNETEYDAFFLGTTEDFFNQNKERFDAIFIDADHSFQRVKRDLTFSMDILNYNGIVFIHDTDPVSKELLDPGYCGDSYKIIDWMRRVWPVTVDCLTLPICKSGLTIIKRRIDRRIALHET